MLTNIFGKISIGIWSILFDNGWPISDIDPRQDWVLSDVIIISTCDFVEPLKILIIRHELIDPSQRLLRVHIVSQSVFLYFDKWFDAAQEIINISEIKMK